MNPSPNPNTPVEMLLALRSEKDAIQLITEYLKVKEMGPADHIRTKHEVKVFVESGDSERAAALVKNSQMRRESNLSITAKLAQEQSRQIRH